MQINPFTKLKHVIEQRSGRIEQDLVDLNNSVLELNKEVLCLKKRIRILSGDKIKVVFVCHRPQVWGALKTVCDSCISDNDFDVTIVAIPAKKQMAGIGLGHENYMSEGAEEFFKDYPCRVINGYDYESRKWFDLRKLKSDYLFFQTPYDISRPPEYQSKLVAKYTHLCYIPYAFPIFGREIEECMYPIDFFSKLYFVFVHNEWQRYCLLNRLKCADDGGNINNINVEVSGYPKFDGLEMYKDQDCSFWKYQKDNRKFRIIWTPRWSTAEGNCYFFEYNDLLLRYATENPDVEIAFRPHPQMWLELVSTGELTETEVKSIKDYWNSGKNTLLDETYTYFDKFFSSDLLISDSSTILGPYLLTGKPIIYCYKTDDFNEEGQRLAKGFYFTHSWKEVVDKINELKNGEDNLKNSRSEIIKNEFYIPEKGAGIFVKECLKEDFYEKRR